MFQADRASEWDAGSAELPRAVASYNDDPAKAAEHCFDRKTSERVPVQRLLSYRQALANYHRHPESKSVNAGYADAGPTRRRHVQATAVVYIGKEANRWEEQSYVGYDVEAEITYGMAPDDRRRLVQAVREAADLHGQRALAKTAQVSLQQVSAILTGVANPTDETLARLLQAVAALNAASNADAARRAELLAWVRVECERRGLREFTRFVGIDAANLAKALAVQRRLSRDMVAKLEMAFARIAEDRAAAD